MSLTLRVGLGGWLGALEINSPIFTWPSFYILLSGTPFESWQDFGLGLPIKLKILSFFVLNLKGIRTSSVEINLIFGQESLQNLDENIMKIDTHNMEHPIHIQTSWMKLQSTKLGNQHIAFTVYVLDPNTILERFKIL